MIFLLMWHVCVCVRKRDSASRLHFKINPPNICISHTQMYVTFFRVNLPLHFILCAFLPRVSPALWQKCVGAELLWRVHSIELPKKQKDAKWMSQGTRQGTGGLQCPDRYCSCKQFPSPLHCQVGAQDSGMVFGGDLACQLCHYQALLWGCLRDQQSGRALPWWASISPGRHPHQGTHPALMGAIAGGTHMEPRSAAASVVPQKCLVLKLKALWVEISGLITPRTYEQYNAGTLGDRSALHSPSVSGLCPCHCVPRAGCLTRGSQICRKAADRRLISGCSINDFTSWIASLLSWARHC